MTPEAQAERDAIVAFLREQIQVDLDEISQRPDIIKDAGAILSALVFAHGAAKAIQRGDHLQPPPQ